MQQRHLDPRNNEKAKHGKSEWAEDLLVNVGTVSFFNSKAMK